MPVPFETLIPYGIILAVGQSFREHTKSFIDARQMFGVSGAGMSKIRHMQNGDKRHRWSVDQWDRVRFAMESGVVVREPAANNLAAKYILDTRLTDQRILTEPSDGS
jgi:hypothetical protein